MVSRIIYTYVGGIILVNQIDKNISTLQGTKKDWTSKLVEFFRGAYPDLSETFENNMPTYRGEGFYIAFAARKNYFSFYTDDVRVLSLIKELSPTANLGKKCAKIKYSEQSAMEILTDAIKEIVDYHNARRSTAVTDIKAAKKWADISTDTHQLIIDNVFCSNCGVTTIVDYALQNDRLGIVLKGKCKKCGKDVARFVEDQ